MSSEGNVLRGTTLLIEPCVPIASVGSSTFTIHSTIFNGFVAFSADGTNVTLNVINVIRRVIDILGDELSRKRSKSEKSDLRNCIFKLVIEAREEEVSET
jgi:hypothetical protein